MIFAIIWAAFIFAFIWGWSTHMDNLKAFDDWDKPSAWKDEEATWPTGDWHKE